MSGLTTEAEKFADERLRHIKRDSVPEPYVPEPLSPDGQAFRDHLARMQNDYEYKQNVLKLRKDCDKCDMDIANTLSCKGSSCSVMGGKRRSKKHCKKHSKKNRHRCTTSRRRSRARRSI
jgi:hypothetical protein